MTTDDTAAALARRTANGGHGCADVDAPQPVLDLTDPAPTEGCTMATYPDVESYTADVIAARDAYSADMAVQRGLCEKCQSRKRDGAHRKCHTCRRQFTEDCS